MLAHPVTKVFYVGCRAALFTALAINLLPSSLSAQELSADEKSAGFVSLFNGKDLTGWQFGDGISPPAKLPDNWKVEDGVIKLSGGGKPHLLTAQPYGNFELRFQWRGMRASYNSGFYIRSQRGGGSNQINLAKGSEGVFVGSKATGGKAVPQLQKPPMEWNEWRVICTGDKVSFWCNDQLAWEAENMTPAEGHIGFQAEGAPLEFRNIRIRAIKP